jgi:hypothetical protein
MQYCFIVIFITESPGELFQVTKSTTSPPRNHKKQMSDPNDHTYPPPSCIQDDLTTFPISQAQNSPGRVEATSATFSFDVEQGLTTQINAPQISSATCCRAYTAIIMLTIPAVFFLAYVTNWSNSLVDLIEKIHKLFAKGFE